MKQLLTALLILICCGCKEKGYDWDREPTPQTKYGEPVKINDSTIVICPIHACDTFIVNEGLGPITDIKIDTLWTYVMSGDKVIPIWTTVERKKDSIRLGGAPKPFPLPDTTKPLKVKMQPRWRDSVIIGEGLTVYGNDSILLGGTLSVNTVIDRKEHDSFISKWTDASKATMAETFTITPIQDTSRCLLLVSDTSNQNGFRSSRCWWMEGYNVFYFPSGDWKPGVSNYHYEYLDQSKIPLKKNIIVWLSKEIK